MNQTFCSTTIKGAVYALELVLVSLPLFTLSFILSFTLSVPAKAQTPPPPETALTFMPPEQFNLGSKSANNIAAGDFNGDGTADIAAIDEDGKLYIFINAGTGKLSAPVIGNFPAREMIAADFNGDGRSDLAATSGGSLIVSMSNGNGTFTPYTSYPQDSDFAISITAGDFYNDGLTHLIISRVYYGGQFPLARVYKNKGDGTFTTGEPFGISSGTFIASNDLNNDGLQDFVTSNTGFGPRSYSIYYGTGNGRFDEADTIQMPGYVNKATLIDLDEDGLIDLVTPSSGEWQLNWARAKTTATYEAGKSFYPQLADRIWTTLVPADFDNDGHIDLALKQTGKISILEGLGKGVFSTPIIVPAKLNAVEVGPLTVADLDGDGAKDLVYAQLGTPAVFFSRNLTPQKQGKILQILSKPSGGNSGLASLSILDNAAAPGDTVSLVRGSEVVKGTDLLPDSTEEYLYTVIFDLTGKTPGVYDLVIEDTHNETRTLPQAFTVEQGGAAQITLNISGRNQLRGGRDQLYLLEFKNNGNADAKMLRFWIKVPDFIAWSTPENQLPKVSGKGNGFNYFAFDVPRVPPGVTESIPFRLRAPGAPEYGHRPFRIETWQDEGR